jgi:myo-inositol 2-dehydrogenase/D-chiro-inositol 1-dehydrogenase
LIDLGVHAVDLVRAVTGDDVTHVSAVLNGRSGDVETDAQLLVRMGAGATGSIHASWSARPGPDHQLTVVGTDGTLHLDSRTPLTRVTASGERSRVELPGTTSSPLDEFLAAVRGERAPEVTAADGRAAVAVVEAAYRSAATGELVEVQR